MDVLGLDHGEAKACRHDSGGALLYHKAPAPLDADTDT